MDIRTRPVLGVLLAIVITTVMDANGLTQFSALPLLPLLALFWYLEKFSRQEIGLVWGSRRHYGLAVLYPVVVLGTITIISAAMGAVDVTETNWNLAWLNLMLITISTILIAILTEEGFFRGWLWASLRRTRQSLGWTLFWTSVAFSLWHLSAIILTAEFALPVAQIPIFLLNATMLGAIWGLIRWVSGSVIIASVSHGVWNGLTYTLFGFGINVGALGIQETAWYGPEVGILGFVINFLFFVGLWRWHEDRRKLN